MTNLLLLPLLLAAPALPGDSIYQLDAGWTDQAGRATKLVALRGQLVVLAMVFTNCGYACPRMIARMKRIEAGLTPAERGRVRFLLVSIDPRRDTPPVLAAYAKRKGLDLRRWTLLRGAPEAVRELSAALSVRYKRAGSGDIAHSNLLTLLDLGGSVIHQLEGLDSGVDPLVAALRAKLK